MRELSEQIRSAAENFSPDKDLELAAQKWAISSLNNYTGDLLEKSLLVSKAIIDFVEEYRMKGGEYRIRRELG